MFVARDAEGGKWWRVYFFRGRGGGGAIAVVFPTGVVRGCR